MAQMRTRPSAAVLGGSAEQSDEALVEQILAGNPSLFEVLMRRHNERLYRAARAILRDEAEAEDVMQQAYVTAFVHLAQFAGRARFSTWLTRIAVNEALARARRRGRFEALDDEAVASQEPDSGRGAAHAVDDRDDPERQAFVGEVRTLLQAAIDALPDGYREVFVLREVEGLSTGETAICLSVAEDVVKTRLHRARARLRRELFDQAGLLSSSIFRFDRPRCDAVVAAVWAQLDAH
jgi:RNA polymerase sigma-70 factor (ECF subfamily)